MGKGKKAAPPPPEAIDVEKYRLTAELAVADSEAMRRLTAEQKRKMQSLADASARQTAETDELYEYLDAQLLATSRERHDNEAKLRDFQAASERTEAALKQRIDEQSREAARTVQMMQSDLDAKERELEGVQEFRGKRPQMEAELHALRDTIQRSAEERQRKEHQQQVDMWRQKQALNEQMVERIKQAKANFLDITAEMLDSTVHRTMHENQNMADELSLQSARLESLMEENGALRRERDGLRRELQLMRDQEAVEVRRSLARRKMAQTATQQHESLTEELRLARAELRLAAERSGVHETTITKLQTQLSAAQRRIAALMDRVAQQEQLIEKRLNGPTSPTAMLPTPDWSLILPDGPPDAKQPPDEPHPPDAPAPAPTPAPAPAPAPPSGGGGLPAGARFAVPPTSASPAGGGMHNGRPQTAATSGSPRAPANTRAGSAARALHVQPTWGASASLSARAPSRTTGYATDRDLLSAALLDHMSRSGASQHRTGAFSARAITSRPTTAGYSPRSQRAGAQPPPVSAHGRLTQPTPSTDPLLAIKPSLSCASAISPSYAPKPPADSAAGSALSPPATLALRPKSGSSTAPSGAPDV